MKKLNRIISFLLVTALLMNVMPKGSNVAFASTDTNEKQVIHIQNEDDFIEFAENCSLDSYSRDKIFVLDQDLNFTGRPLTPVGIFGGTFDGNGKTIKGLIIDGTGSNLALFRYLEPTAELKSLRVEGTIKPDGSSENLAGIVANNMGRIVNCHFIGKVEGKSTVGGIVAVNGPSGYITNSTAKGKITAESLTGGIVGRNEGTIIQCQNNAEVNTSSIEPEFQIQDIGNYAQDTDVVLHTDTGGIAGYSSGIIQSSINYGKIGYPHVGYNVGGIAGRQSGYMKDCTNHGDIQGRKDVSGIVGQMEPYLEVNFQEDTLQKLDNELDTLKHMMNTSLDTIDSSGQDASDRMSKIQNLTDNASTELEDMINSTTDFTDDTVEQINEVSYRFSTFLDEAEPALDDLSEATDKLSTGLNEMSEAFAHLETASTEAEEMAEHMRKASNELGDAMDYIGDAMDKISDANLILETGLGDPVAMDKAIDNLEEGFTELENAFNSASNIMITLSELMGEMDEFWAIDWDKYSAEIKTNALAMQRAVSEANPKIKAGIKKLREVTKSDLDILRAAFSLFRDAFDYLDDASSDLESFSLHLSRAMRSLSKVSKSLGDASDGLEKSSTTLSDASTSLTNAINKIDNAVEDLNAKPNIEFPKLGDTLKEPTENFFLIFDDITDEVEALNQSTSQSRRVIIQDLKAINNQLAKIFDLIMEERKSALDGVELYKDISENDLTSIETEVILGHVIHAVNSGSVEGDFNVGGIVGSMAKDYDFDPEGDITDSEKTLNLQYLTRSVLYNSTNTGAITSKKDYVGGLVGKMDTGILLKGENYGSVISNDGDYVGGIAGSSSTTIRHAYAKCPLSGGSYVGGIVGSGENLYNSYSLIRIDEAKEFAGSIAGEVKGQFKDNYFLKNEWDGIDDISYVTKAEPMTFDSLMKVEVLPPAFKEFKLDFTVNHEIIHTVTFEYGDSISMDQLPAIPTKEGFFASWPEHDYNHLIFSDRLEAIYSPDITTIASDTQSDADSPLLLAEGIFTPDSKLEIEAGESCADYKDNNYKEIANISLSILSVKDYDDAEYTYRYYYPHAGKELKLLYLTEANEWATTDAWVDGSYIVFRSNRKDLTVCILEKESNHLYLYIALGSIALIGIMGFVFFKKRRKKVSKQNNTTV